MTSTRPSNVPATWLVIAAFTAVYIIWGSTYLAIRFAIDTIPPFLMAGVRFVIAGGLICAWMGWRGVKPPTRLHWRSAAIIGLLLLVGGNGGVSWAEQRIPSGLASVLVAMVPLWVVVLNWVRPGGSRPGFPILLGVGIGFMGILLLVSPADSAHGSIDPVGALALLIATLCWASGSLYSRGAALPDSPLLTTGMEMLCGGVLLLILGTLTGEWNQFEVSRVSFESVAAVVYLIIFGAIIAFTAYIWLLRVATPARAATYAYVNPVVAVFLGWAFAGEALTARTLIAAAIIIVSVVIITTYRPKPVDASALPDEQHGFRSRLKMLVGWQAR